jgi:hypothetical protein
MNNVIDHPKRKDRFRFRTWMCLSVDDFKNDSQALLEVLDEIDRQAEFLRDHCCEEVRALIYLELAKSAAAFNHPELTDRLIARFGLTEADREYAFLHFPKGVGIIYQTIQENQASSSKNPRSIR